MSLIPNTAKYDLDLQLQACQSQSRRNGKVARLPAPMREQINRMLDDGIPYKTIIEKLGPEGRHLNEDNISNWRLGGYQDRLKAQLIMERARVQTETAADLVRDSNHADAQKLKEACTQMALLHYFKTLFEHGELCANDSLAKNPAKLITLINACSNMATANIAIQEHKWALEDRDKKLKNQNQKSPPSEPLRT